jgi:hypothetical protein
MSDQPDDSAEIPTARRAVLAYQRSLPTSAVTVRKCRDIYEAQIFANELAANGIDYYVMNQNTNDLLGTYVGFTYVELQVRKEEAEAASALLSKLSGNPLEVEPAEASNADQPIPDPAGEGILVSAAGFDNPRSLLDAAATLGAARVESFLPMLVVRGDGPAGVGDRFILRVREDDAEQAREILSKAAAEESDDEEPRCPTCGSYRVMAVPQFWKDVMRFLRGDTDRSVQMQCLLCRHLWTIDRPVSTN